jgi:amidase
MRAYLVALAAQVAADLESAATILGRRPSARELEPETALLNVAGRRLSACELVRAEAEMHRAAQALAAFHSSFDLFVTPTLAMPPQPVGSVGLEGFQRAAVRTLARFPLRALLDAAFDTLAARSFDATGNTMLFNQTGQPAMSVPLHFTAAGLPVGVQFVARFGEEATLLRVAAQLESAKPWADRVPHLS